MERLPVGARTHKDPTKFVALDSLFALEDLQQDERASQQIDIDDFKTLGFQVCDLEDYSFQRASHVT